MLKAISFVSVLFGCVYSHQVHPHSVHEHELAEAHLPLHQRGRSCQSPQFARKLMEIDETYRQGYELEHLVCNDFVDMMRAIKHDGNNMKKSKIGNDFENEIENEKEKGKRQLIDMYNASTFDNVVWIPIVYHVFYSNSYENISDAQLDSQIRVMNEDFRGNNTEIDNGQVSYIFENRVGDAKFQFYKVHTYRIEINESQTFCSNESWFKQSKFGGSDGWNPDIFLNVWVCNITESGLLGYAYPPCLLNSTTRYLDGLVLGSDNIGSKADDSDDSFWFPENSTYIYGRTGTHEVGHYFNLDHTWGADDNGTCNDTDYVEDTPNQYGPNYGCPDFNDTNSCYQIDEYWGKDLRDMTENFMDYTNDNCMYIFSEEQVWRMRAVVSPYGCRYIMYYNGINGINYAYYNYTGDESESTDTQTSTTEAGNEDDDSALFPSVHYLVVLSFVAFVCNVFSRL